MSLGAFLRETINLKMVPFHKVLPLHPQAVRSIQPRGRTPSQIKSFFKALFFHQEEITEKNVRFTRRAIQA